MMEKKKILLVDDSEVQLAVANNILKDEYEIFMAKSGEEALRRLCSNNFVPDVVLLDILMPEMNGWETFNKIKAISLLKSVQVAFLTSVSEVEEKEKAYKIGAADFITKPYEKEILLDRVRNIVNKSKN